MFWAFCTFPQEICNKGSKDSENPLSFFPFFSFLRKIHHFQSVHFLFSQSPLLYNLYCCSDKLLMPINYTIGWK